MSFISPLADDLAVVFLPLMPVRLVQLLGERGIELVHVPDDEFETMGPNVLALAPRVALALEGNNAIALCRSINGATKPVDAAPGSIRGDFTIEVGQNLVHASDSAENAQTELALWFAADELHEYDRAADEWVVGPQG